MLAKQLKKIHSVLDKAKIDHALIGGLALGARGVQRFTNDIDLLVSEEDIDRLLDLLEARGFEVFHRSPEILQLNGEVPVDIVIARRPISLKMLKEAKKLKPYGVKCISAEGLIALKVQAYQNDRKRELQDKSDIQALIENNKIDWQKLKPILDLFDEWDEIQSIRKRVE